jgi:hypothetical protein
MYTFIIFAADCRAKGRLAKAVFNRPPSVQPVAGASFLQAMSQNYSEANREVCKNNTLRYIDAN